MDIVEQMRGFESDHEPDGWPAIQMKQVSALCDEIERLQGIIDGANAQGQWDRWLENEFRGPPPIGYKDWYDWMLSPVKSFAYIESRPMFSSAQQSPAAAVQICDECDIADCKHVRNATLQIIVNKSPRITEQDALPDGYKEEWKRNVMLMWSCVRKHDSSIPSDVLDYMRETLLNKLNSDKNGK